MIIIDCFDVFLYFCRLKCNVEMSKSDSVIEHTGVVERIHDGRLLVTITQMAACAGCHARSACGAADMSEKQIDAISTDSDIRVGDHVVVYGHRALGMRAVFLAFVLPFFILLATLFLLQQTSLSEGLSGTLSLVTLIPYYIVLSFFKDKLKRSFIFYARKSDV